MALEFTWLLVVNLIGCFVLLAALFLGQTQIVEASSFLGLALNFFGGFILFVGACYGVFVMKNVELVPSIILNVVWTLLSAISFIHKWMHWKKPKSVRASALPVTAVRQYVTGDPSSDQHRPDCDHDSAVWTSINRGTDGNSDWEWETQCDICGMQVWHMPTGWSKEKDENGNVVFQQQWHAKKI